MLRVLPNGCVLASGFATKHDLRLLHLFCTFQGRDRIGTPSRTRDQTMTLRLSTLSALLLVHIGVMPAGAQAASQSNEAVSLSVGASEMIVLSENPASGYIWQLNTAQSSNLAIVRVIDTGYQPSQSGQMAAAGSHWWQIEARVPGTAKIVFAYSRPSENGALAKSHAVEVNITGGQ